MTNMPSHWYGGGQAPAAVHPDGSAAPFFSVEKGVSFLLTLKHRSVTPDVFADENDGENDSRTADEHMMERLSTSRSSMFSTADFTGRVGNGGNVNPNNNINKRNGVVGADLLRPRSVSLALPDDKHWLSELQCYIRSNCCEFFAATEADVSTKSKSSARRSASSSASSSNNRHHRNAPHGSSGAAAGRRGLTIGRVGIRCVFCRDDVRSDRAAQSTSFPSQLSSVYGSVVMMQCRHFPNCKRLPPEVRDALAAIKKVGSSTPSTTAASSSSHRASSSTGRQQYWADSARRLGLVDTSDGIRFASDFAPIGGGGGGGGTIGIVASEEFEKQQHRLDESSSPPVPLLISPDFTSSSSGGYDSLAAPPMREPAIDFTLPASLDGLLAGSTLVAPQDKDLVPDYLFVALAQMVPCRLSECDRIGSYKARPIGFIGMCCRHCGGGPGSGKYFPATVRSLAQTTTSQTIVKHVGYKCRRVPEDVRSAVVSLQRNCPLEKSHHNNGGNDGHNGDCAAADGRPKYGSRKVFFQRVWRRLHGKDNEEASSLSPPHDVSSTSSESDRMEGTAHLPTLFDVASSSSSSSRSPAAAHPAGPTSGEETGINKSEAGEASSVAVSPSLASSSSSIHNLDDHCPPPPQRELYDDKNRRIVVRCSGWTPSPAPPSRRGQHHQQHHHVAKAHPRKRKSEGGAATLNAVPSQSKRHRGARSA